MRAPPPLRALERVQRGLGPCLGLTHSIAGINPVHQLLRVIAAYGLIQGMTSDLVCITKCTRCFAGRSASHTHAHTHTHTHTHSFLSVRLTAATAECRVDTWTLPAGKLDAHEISHPLRVGAFVKHARARAHTERPAVVVVATSRAAHSRGSPLACSFGQAWSLCESYSLALITCAIYYGAALVDKEPFDP